ncbi:MAG TPA: tRNA pseudouridine(38-40) synthase TruA [Dehalococcoidia bacterium]|nr:tRNA pseudouridine(38-40) synthase TruA [Dehalococcoidia bacterium]
MVLTVEYDGTKYHGSQYQANAVTIQGEIECALYKLTGEKVRIATSSRTDAGVHAKGQVVSFKTKSAFPQKTWVKALNFYLPGDIAVKAAYGISNGFDVRHDALSREYCYFILNSSTPSPLRHSFAHIISQPLDIEAMNYAAEVLPGEHDFASFSSVVNGQTRRRVYKAEVDKGEDLVTFDMVASSFLPHQVRNTAGGLIEVGLGRMKVETFRELARLGRAGAIGPTAPAHGLCLMKVNYVNFPPLVEEGKG